jgi:methionyl aminopeptidase
MAKRKSSDEIAKMRVAGRVVAEMHEEIRAALRPGVTTLQLDAIGREVLDRRGAQSNFLHYHGYPAVICASPNDTIVHGIPDDYVLKDGDLVSIDCGATLDGWTGDAATSFIVGTPRPADLLLIETAEKSLAAGIAAAVAGARIGDISHAIGTIGRSARYGIPSGFGGHGIGRQMHEDPHVPNEGRPGRGLRLKPGLALAIEPMLMAGGGDEFRVAADGWGLRSTDGSRAAHVEHSVAITDAGPRILTLP